MDKMYVNGMKFYGYHGVFMEEQKLGQRFNVDVTLSMDLSKAGLTDELDQTVNYGEVYDAIKEIVEGEPVKLLESLAESIAATLLSKFTLVEETTVKVIKPDPPIPGHYDSVAVEITRGRS
ncbi:dihydroneopterin aldolase [Fictibacillus phosphorivorans]|uniref:dihydroneopterin aldolase n=1 Tax=Fictibacillus phosphorivorans TaxID=1221500 RepID=UPI0020420D6E|nr:dihydroneopterin aldolase [Fictibacillus phosphorivorans]MCM3719852.1 dihydroneopterin aldolase [Fictibacillus phosphorivorans]MCM3777542.1 dihydroneopterin aldolase [Fictibacillus phosphorivorans]